MTEKTWGQDYVIFGERKNKEQNGETPSRTRKYNKVNCKERTTCTNSSEVKPDLMNLNERLIEQLRQILTKYNKAIIEFGFRRI